MKKTCAVSGKTFEISSEDLAFYEKMGVPTPTLCPEERMRRRMAWKNETNLYRRTCDATGKTIISVYSSDKPFPVYEPSYWWSDHWNPLDYGREFDFNQPFFPQFFALLNDVPKISLDTLEVQNSDFVSLCSHIKDCYLCFEMDDAEHCCYTGYANKVTNIFDSLCINDSQHCYECVSVDFCYNCRFVYSSSHCRDSSFLRNCTNCRDCFGCVNLKHKQYYFLNQACSKEEYEAKIAAINFGSHQTLQALQQDFAKFCLKFPRSCRAGGPVENSTGDHLSNTKNCLDCFRVEASEEARHIVHGHQVKDSQDLLDGIYNIEQCYESVALVFGASNTLFSWNAISGCRDVYYGFWLKNCQDCFGCSALRNKQYCIFNQQYSKHDYFVLRDRIIAHLKKTGEWGEFFPIADSIFAYNESIAQDTFPLSKSQALARGYPWQDQTKKALYQGPEVLIPDDITQVSDDIVNEILTCTVSGKNYRLVKAELDFYRQQNVPIPRECFEVRLKRRREMINHPHLYDRQCDRCHGAIKTTFAPDRPEIVWCENCYQKHALT